MVLGGLRWCRLKEENYHLNKTIQANAKGYDLLHFTDKEWFNKNDKGKSLQLIADEIGSTKQTLPVYFSKFDIQLRKDLK